MFQSMKVRLLTLGAGAALLASGLVGMGVVRAQTAPPSGTPPAATQQAPTGAEREANETPGAEKNEANEPALPGGGHADQPGVDVQHEFDGIE